ncbi:unnamed protein product [Nesidiocoris tenuis]|uniref:Uncharacterized protein n=1 Tax=Nesidiocoris tenuis TaxID=355587 RepID=A0A6H5G9C5_9HEMI|nr:unnamed protein product [Nesidiocoris tenuis]
MEVKIAFRIFLHEMQASNLAGFYMQLIIRQYGNNSGLNSILLYCHEELARIPRKSNEINPWCMCQSMRTPKKYQKNVKKQYKAYY